MNNPQLNMRMPISWIDTIRYEAKERQLSVRDFIWEAVTFYLKYRAYRRRKVG